MKRGGIRTNNNDFTSNTIPKGGEGIILSYY